MARKISVEIVGDASSLERAFGKASSASSGFGSKLGSVAKIAGLAIGGAALGGIAFTLKTGIEEWTQSTKVAAQTEAVLKSTGGAAGVTAAQISGLANSIMRKTGIDDEAIQSGENLLLTFTNIRNEAGRGNDIFTQSTKILSDMSVALGQDTKSSAIQLGKALNDPIKGITALQRVGVSFTQAQRDQIKALVDSGHTMEAQKLILGELNKEFGGSAEAAGKTLPGQLNILKETFNNLAGNIIGAVVPSLTSVTGWITSDGLPGLQALGNRVSAGVQPAFAAFGDFVSTNIKPILIDLWHVFQQDIIPIWQRFASVVAGTINAVSGVIHSHLPEIKKIFENLGGAIKDIGIVVMPILKFAFEKVLPAAIAIAIPVLKTITTIIKGVTDVLKDVVQWVGTVGNKLGDIPGALKKAFGAVAGTLGAILKAPVNAVIQMIDAIHIPGFKIHVPLVGDIGWGGYTPFHIPMLAEGGIVTRPTVALIGERGPEAVVPLSRGGGSFAQGASYQFVFPNYLGSRDELMRELSREFNRYLRQNGVPVGGLS